MISKSLGFPLLVVNVTINTQNVSVIYLPIYITKVSNICAIEQCQNLGSYHIFPFCVPNICFHSVTHFHHLCVVSFPLQHSIKDKTIDAGFLIQEQAPQSWGVQTCVKIESESIWIWISQEDAVFYLHFLFPVRVFPDFLFRRKAGV